MMGKAKGWKVLRKRIERREFTEDLRQSNLQLNRMDEKSPMLRFDLLASKFLLDLIFSQLPRKSDKSQMPKAEDDDLRELEDESESYADYGTQMVELTKNLHIEKTKKKKSTCWPMTMCFKTRRRKTSVRRVSTISDN